MHATADSYQGVISRLDFAREKMDTPKEDIEKRHREAWGEMKEQGQG